MRILHIKAWHPDKAWAGDGSFTQHIASRRLERVAAVRGVALRRLTRRLLRREVIAIPLRDEADLESFLSYLAGFGAEVALDPAATPSPNKALQPTAGAGGLPAKIHACLGPGGG